MKKFELYQVDAFTDKLFGGNPACVVPLDKWLPDELLLKIAKENAVPETAFFIRNEPGFHIRWFTNEFELDLCGHATLATAHILKTCLGYTTDEIAFDSKSGPLSVYNHNGRYTLNFPSRMPIPSSLPDVIKQALSVQPKEILKSRDYVLVYENEQDVRNIKINKHILDTINLDPGGIIITAAGDTVDFVSRFFTTQSAIFEDPVTGSAHCSLIPYWSKQLKKNQLLALQLSERGGRLYCTDEGERVLIAGHACTYSFGHFYLNGFL